ncbi:WD40 repeat domain-containing serine/threonine-protein kinase [Flavonifractor sp. An100]|uniref:WD40 repeat domain-containing serine/threonine-protein kinase n=1 Tax=Flavonifractor sp. An100 TaxID=1965538 RepID=UPI000B36BBE1|nr:WD40 repeat domain-containing serine/threonine-protein kinase [Flavonifractor sp. An100]OUQ78568.1 hypothetical protein B5E43_07710 [Flavonifractor sp. An100]
MSHIVASTYEILGEIGSGGGGVVYLAKHLRLGKQVVLKADKRTLSAKPEVLRREVDALKNLSHTYIPQVYDFVAEDGVVYTVMDYIQGESLDKPLKRGERFSQPQVIHWARQLLEALCYLHSRPPHGILHSDIKPANIMLTPSGDICLIDFNIALALGEEGAVRVGFSRGYASPEHYGLDYTAAAVTQGLDTDVNTRLTEGATTQLPVVGESSSSGSGSGSGQRTVLLDVRSDIYSLGATLYHLLTGVRPAQDAKEVFPIGDQNVSPAVAAIVQKAMQPNPDLRYQTAEEMLAALNGLHENDPRSRRHKRRERMAAAVLALVFLGGGLSTFVGLKRMEAEQAAYALAEYSGNALASGDVAGAVDYALQALPDQNSILTPPYIPQAQRALADALGVYDLSDGFKALESIQLPSEPLKLVLSPEGTRLAALYAYEAAVYDTATGGQLAALPAEPSALSDLVFSGEDKLIYAGEGALRAYDLAQGQELWAGGPATGIALSADGSRVAGVYKDQGTASVYDAATGALVKTVEFGGRGQRTLTNDTFADPEDNLFALSADGSWLAVSFSDGTLAVFDLETGENDLELLDPSGYTHFEGGFYGPYLAFSASGSGEDALFAVIDTENLVQTGGFSGQQPFRVQAGEDGIFVATENVLVKLDPVTGEQTEVAYTQGSTITGFSRGPEYTMVATGDQTFWFFDRGAGLLSKEDLGYSCDFVQAAGPYAVAASRDTPQVRVLRLEDHSQSQIFSYDPTYDHDELRLSADGQTVMLFRYNAFRLYGIDGGLIREVSIPDPNQVYDQQYRRVEGDSYLEVIYYDGTVRTYSAADGSLRSETAGEAPNPDLYEEFFTDRLRITAPLHEAPVAYDRETGEEIRTLEQDAYLTYVTQVGEYVVTEYISAQGERYGLLLDENCETLAYLPDLCDIVGDRLVFDYPSGSVRESRIYSIQELIALGNTYKEV